jgi:N6-adenosine-specific RNA methylase IME4
MKTEPFKVIACDPPWGFRDSLPGPKRGAASHYPCMSVSEIARFPLPPIADDAALILWRVAAMPEEALFVCRAWGFKPKAELVWVKTKADGTGVRRGMGRTVRNGHEVAIIATRGRPERLSRSEPSVIFAPRSEHSRKPDAAYELIDRLYDGPRCELFARTERPGWTTYGLDVGRPSP